MIRASIGKHFVDYKGSDLKSLGLSAAGEGETAGDVVNQQAERLALLLGQIDELGAELRISERVREVTIKFPWRATGT